MEPGKDPSKLPPNVGKPFKKMYHAYLTTVEDNATWQNDIENDEDSDVKKEEGKFGGTNLPKNGFTGILTSQSKVRRVFWLVIWILTGINCINQCYKVIEEYLRFDQIISSEDMEETQLQFPAVTFCSLSPFSLQNIASLKDSPVLISAYNLGIKYTAEDTCNETDWNSDCVPEYDENGKAYPCNITSDYYYDYGGNQPNATAQLISEDEFVLLDYDHTENDTFWDNYFGSESNLSNQSDANSTLSSPHDLRKTSNNQKKAIHDDKLARIATAMLTGKKKTAPKKPAAKKPKKKPQKTQKSSATSIIAASEVENSTEFVRKSCSVTYQRLLYEMCVRQDVALADDELVGDLSKCSADGYEVHDAIYDNICGSIVIQDTFGNYSQALQDCVPYFEKVVNLKTQICSSCCKTRCIDKAAYEAVQNNISQRNDALLESIIKNRKAMNSVNKIFQTREEIDKLSVRKEEFISLCGYDQLGCTLNDFAELYDHQYGKCYTFNSAIPNLRNKGSPTTKYTRFYGQNYGFRITLNLNTDKLMPLLSPEIGVRVILHQPNALPFPDKEGFNILPGDSSSVKVFLNKITRLPPPWGECGSDTVNSTVLNYSSALCRKTCLEEIYRDECKCYVGISSAYDNVRPFINSSGMHQCSIFNPKERVCVDDVLFRFNQKVLGCDCPLSCSEWSYIPVISANGVNKEYQKILQGIKKKKFGTDLCGASSDNTTIRLLVYLDKLRYTNIEAKKAYSIDTLISNVGANLGLFVGLSIMSVAKVVEFIVDAALNYMEKRKVGGSSKENKKKQIPVYLLVEYDSNENGFPNGGPNDMKIIPYSEAPTRPPIGNKTEMAQSAFKEMFIS